MNLSKIAVGVAVSLCLVSNVALADSSPKLLSASQSSNPTKPELAETADKIENSKPQDNVIGLSLIDKAKIKLAQDKPRVDTILDRIKPIVENKHNSSAGKSPRPIHKVSRRMTREEKQKQDRWIAEWGKLSEEEKKLILKSHGYFQAYKKLSTWSGSGHPIEAALFSSFDILNEDVNKALYDAEANKKAIDVAQEKNEKSVDGLTKSIEQNKKDINLNKEAIKVNSASIKDNRENIQKNKKSIEKNIASIDANKAKIELNHKAIQDVKSQLNSRLDNLNKDLRRGLATQSALTGLFQPYSVGKMNVTAAVGGYQSEKAIAVGSGYRFNDNFAAKVGLSKSLGGSAVSYNMGVNYEF